jgi:hypothetical protein
MTGCGSVEAAVAAVFDKFSERVSDERIKLRFPANHLPISYGLVAQKKKTRTGEAI